MAESGMTIGSIFALLFATIIMMGVLQPLMTFAGVYNPSVNSTTAAGNYISSIYGTKGLYNQTTNQTVLAVIPLEASANQSSKSVNSNLLSITSGFAFIAAGISTFFSSLLNSPGLIITIFTESLNYGAFKRLLPVDIAALITVSLFAYMIALLSMKLISIISKPGQSVENL